MYLLNEERELICFYEHPIFGTITNIKELKTKSAISLLILLTNDSFISIFQWNNNYSCLECIQQIQAPHIFNNEFSCCQRSKYSLELQTEW